MDHGTQSGERQTTAEAASRLLKPSVPPTSHMMSSHMNPGISGDPYRGLVNLARPLPCTAGKLGVGFVIALASDRLILRLTQANHDANLNLEHLNLEASQSLMVSLESGQSYQFQSAIFQPLPPSELPAASASAPALDQLQLFAALTAPQSHERQLLADLMTVVRKDQHIAICQTQDVEATDRYTGFEDLRLRPKALPELSWDELELRQQFLGHEFAAPILITGMTGGLARGAEINHRLARVAAHFGIPMGVGSQRVALENPEHAAIFSVKKKVPEVFLIGNLGIAQLGGQSLQSNLDTCLRAVEMIEADAMAIHINILQELVQVEGDRDFRGLLDRLAELASRLPVPLLVKEVGGGMDPETAAALAQRGIAAIDVGGKGGTSWSFIEGQRAASPVTKAVAQTFRDWGVPTALSLKSLSALNETLLSRPMDLVATGGIRDGLTVAKAVALGARMAGIGLPLFRAALTSEEAPFQVLETLIRGLKTAMVCAGAKTLDDLRTRIVLSHKFVASMEDHGLANQ